MTWYQHRRRGEPDERAGRSDDNPGMGKAHGPERVSAARPTGLVRRRSITGEAFTLQAGDLYVDLSKNLINSEILSALVDLADQVGLADRRDAMLAGEHINVTEDRAVLHTALRAPEGASLVVDGVDVIPQVHEVLDKVYAFADKVRSGEWVGRHRQADRDRGQHRHRRIRSWSGDGLRGAAAVRANRV